MDPTRLWRRALEGATLAGAAALTAGLVAPGLAGAATNYAVAASITSAGPTVFSAPVTDQPVADLSLHETVPGGLPAGYVCLQPSRGSFTAPTTAQTPTVTATGGIAVSKPTVVGSSLSFSVTAPSTTATGTVTIANLHVTTGASAGRSTVSVTDGLSSPCASSGGHTLASTAAAWAIEGATQDTFGQTAVDTTAIEYGDEFSCSGTTGTVAHTAVLASVDQPLEALASATLQGALHAGLLVTSTTSLDPAVVTALRQDGVTTVYVVGNSSSIAPAVLQALGASQATQCENGVPATTGAKVKVVGPIGGATLDATAAAIAAEANRIAPFATHQPAVDLSSVRVSSYNDTTGNASSAGQAAAAGKTALLDMNTDFLDPMTASGLAYAAHLPILYTPGASLGSSAKGELKSLGVTQVVVLGGQLAVQPAVVNQLIAEGMTVVRVAGEDATDTAGMIARFEDAQAPGAGLGWIPRTAGSALFAQGASASDALGAAAISASGRESIYITKSPVRGLGSYTPKILNEAGSATGLGDGAHPAPIYHLQVLGGPLAVPQSQIAAALLALAGGAG